MRYYPDVPDRRFAVAVRDALVLALIALFALVGLAVHDAVEELAVLGTGVREAGTSVRDALERAADAVDETPVVGGELGDALRNVGQQTGGDVAELGRRGEEAARDLALLLGLTTFGLPTLVTLAFYGPRRFALARKLTDAERVLRLDAPPERRRAVAMRAAFSLPYGRLLAHTSDPLGDLAAERYEPLIAAALEDAGLRPPA